MALAIRAARLDERRLASPAVRGILSRRAAELAGIALALAGIAFLMALISFAPADPSADTATARAVTNLLGLPGAWMADALLQWLGLAAALPGLAMLAWAWRIGSRRGLGSLMLRLISLAAALPILSTVLAGAAMMLARHGAPAWYWPAGSGPGGALGTLVAGSGLQAATDLFGAPGDGIVLALTGLLGAVLAVLALGLSRREWRAAASVAEGAVRGGRRTVALGGRFWARTGQVATGLLDRLNGVRRGPPPNVIQPEPRRADAMGDTAAPWREAAPARVVARAAAQGKRASVASRQESLPLDGPWRFPPLSLLHQAPSRGQTGAPSREALEANARLLEGVLSDYGVQGRIVEIRPGPVVTLYELEPAPGIRSARVIGLADDVARSLSVTAVRIATVPGRNVIGIELPNAKRETVFLSELLGSAEWERQQGRLALALGKDIGGEPVVADLARMPHLLVAGTTGAANRSGSTP